MKADYLNFHGNDQEDRFIFENFELPDNGIFIDIGAGPDGIQGSNTYFFERNGWMGLVIDADPRNYPRLLLNRKHAIEAVVSNNPNETVLYINEDSPDLSGVLNWGGRSKTKIIKPKKLEEILNECNIADIDLISIDTEGSEIDVWESMDWKKHKPKILIIENITQGNINPDIRDYFTRIGYQIVSQVGANLIFSNGEISLK